MEQKIKKLEDQNISEKYWAMTGEVSARDRPEGSLLEVDVDFEHITRAPPVITEEVTAELEDIIKKRIAEESWDDVIRKKEDIKKVKKGKRRDSHGLNETVTLTSKPIISDRADRSKEQRRSRCHL